MERSQSRSVISQASTNLTLIEAQPVELKALFLSNASSADAFLKIYDAGTAPTLASSVPRLRLIIPKGGGASWNCHNLKFTSGLSIAITGGLADTDTTNTGANEVAVNLVYGVDSNKNGYTD